jgi:hypothetical protein
MFQLTELIKQANLARNGSVVVIKGYHKTDGGIADYYLNFKVSYINLLKKSLDIIKGTSILEVYENFKESEVITPRIANEARDSLIESYERRLEVAESGLEGEDNFIDLCSGIKMHKSTNDIYLSGLLIKNPNGEMKDVVKEAEVKRSVTHKPKTLVKNWLESKTSMNRWRMFILNGNFESLSLVVF